MKGFSVLELVLAAALFSIFSLAIVTAVFRGSNAEQAAMNAEIARQWAREGIEAVRAVRSQSFDSLGDSSGTGIRLENGKWEFHGNQDEWDGYERVVTLHPARRDSDGNIVTEGGNEDADLKSVTSTVTKDNFSVEFSAYLSRRDFVPVAP